MTLMRSVLMASLLLVAASCGGGSNVMGNGGAGGGGGGGGYPPGGNCSNGTDANISVCDNYYSPSTATVAAGTTVTWTWMGSASHSVTFTGGPVTPAGSSIQDAGTFSIQLTTPGTYTYQCAVHGTAMQGSITVN